MVVQVVMVEEEEEQILFHPVICHEMSERGELGAAYNIGGAAEFTVRDIGSMLAAKFGLAGDVGVAID